jgi:hypothetical protein
MREQQSGCRTYSGHREETWPRWLAESSQVPRVNTFATGLDKGQSASALMSGATRDIVGASFDHVVYDNLASLSRSLVAHRRTNNCWPGFLLIGVPVVRFSSTTRQFSQTTLTQITCRCRRRQRNSRLGDPWRDSHHEQLNTAQGVRDDIGG